MIDLPGDIYNLRITAKNGGLLIRAVVASAASGEIHTTSMEAEDLRLVARRQGDGSYTFDEIRAKL